MVEGAKSSGPLLLRPSKLRPDPPSLIGEASIPAPKSDLPEVTGVSIASSPKPSPNVVIYRLAAFQFWQMGKLGGQSAKFSSIQRARSSDEWSVV